MQVLIPSNFVLRKLMHTFSKCIPDVAPFRRGHTVLHFRFSADEEDDLVFEDFARMRVHTTADIDDAKLIQA